MIPYLSKIRQPGFALARFGWEAEAAVEEAREEVAKLVNADPKEIVWTSGATESNNLAIKGAANFYSGKGKHIVTVKTEHKAVLDTFRELERQGFEATYLDVQENGLLDLNVFKAALRPDTILVSVMFVNNEIGVIQPIAEIGEICREKGIIFHVDAAQATGKVAIDLSTAEGRPDELLGAQDLRPEGHRRAVCAPQAACPPEAQMHGGGHERGFRSGTLATHQIVGMGEAFRLAREEMARKTSASQAARPAFQGLSDIEVSMSTATWNIVCRTT
jgi:cysteine desulfurase